MNNLHIEYIYVYIYDLISTKLKVILIKTTIFQLLTCFGFNIIHHQNEYIKSILNINNKNVIN